MINKFDSLFNIKTDAISQALGRGKHTTRHTELLRVGSGWIADTPGFGTLDLDMDVVSLSHTFREFFNTKCRFAKCTHLAEPGCLVKEKVEKGIILKSRYENYQNYVIEINSKKKY
jgi:ribosome biogenesis GTPase